MRPDLSLSDLLHKAARNRELASKYSMALRRVSDCYYVSDCEFCAPVRGAGSTNRLAFCSSLPLFSSSVFLVSADSAAPITRGGIDDEVALIGMPISAVRLSSECSSNVLQMRHSLQMAGIATEALAAEVVEFEAFGHRTDQTFIGQDVDLPDATVESAAGVSESVTRPGPKPTFIRAGTAVEAIPEVVRHESIVGVWWPSDWPVIERLLT